MNKNTTLFDEKQNLGSNKQSLGLRIFLSLFCFVAYYYTDIPELNGELLFFLGIAILFISLILLFVTHIRLRIVSDVIHIDGILGTGKVEIPINSITTIEKVKYSKFIINNPVYNLHRNGIVKFYSGGSEAIKLTCANNITYIIGTQKAEEFIRVINDQMNQN